MLLAAQCRISALQSELSLYGTFQDFPSAQKLCEVRGLLTCHPCGFAGGTSLLDVLITSVLIYTHNLRSQLRGGTLVEPVNMEWQDAVFRLGTDVIYRGASNIIIE